MGAITKIEWTEATWNPIRARNKITGKIGWHCEHVSPGCKNYYAEPINEVRFGTGLPFKPGHRDDIEIFLDEKTLLEPLRWRRPRRIFPGSMTDLFGEWVTDAMLDRVFAVMALAPQHDFQVLTKRSARMRAYLSAARAHPVGLEAMDVTLHEMARNPRSDVGRGCILQGDICHLKIWPLPNVWLGVSAEDQTRADERVPDLLATPAAVRFVSAEPLLGPIDFSIIWLRREGERTTELSHRLGDYVQPLRGNFTDSPRLNWIIVGDESGRNRRDCDLDDVRSIRDQCAASGTPFFLKQLHIAGKKVGLPTLDGVEHNGLPVPSPSPEARR